MWDEETSSICVTSVVGEEKTLVLRQKPSTTNVCALDVLTCKLI